MLFECTVKACDRAFIILILHNFSLFLTTLCVDCGNGDALTGITMCNGYYLNCRSESYMWLLLILFVKYLRRRKILTNSSNLSMPQR